MIQGRQDSAITPHKKEQSVELGHTERRRAPRFPSSAKVVVRGHGGEAVCGTAVNISSSGILAQLDGQVSFRPGDEVTVEVALPEDPGKPFSSWGIGKVVRLDAEHAAMHLSAGSFYPLVGEAEDNPCVDPGHRRILIERNGRHSPRARSKT